MKLFIWMYVDTLYYPVNVVVLANSVEEARETAYKDNILIAGTLGHDYQAFEIDNPIVFTFKAGV